MRTLLWTLTSNLPCSSLFSFSLFVAGLQSCSVVLSLVEIHCGTGPKSSVSTMWFLTVSAGLLFFFFGVYALLNVPSCCTVNVQIDLLSYRFLLSLRSCVCSVLCHQNLLASIMLPFSLLTTGTRRVSRRLQYTNYLKSLPNCLARLVADSIGNF